MSELIKNNDSRATIRWKLLTSASALVLTAYVSSATLAKAGDADRPQIWIELGGQFERQTGQGDAFLPPFVANYPDSLAFKPESLLRVEKPALFSNEADGKISFQPEDTNWIFSASVRYGRSTGHRKFHQSGVITTIAHYTELHQTTGQRGIGTPANHLYVKRGTQAEPQTEIAEAQSSHGQNHIIMDFEAGKDVGLGMFGKGGVSDFDVGVRFAQFSSRVAGTINARPDAHVLDPCVIVTYYFYLQSRFPTLTKLCFPRQAQHTYSGTFHAQRNFHGVGPSLSWNASLPVLGEPQAGTLNVDWGVNASVLFGRQRAKGGHHTYAYYLVKSGYTAPRTHHSGGGSFNRSRKIIVPNVGGFAGLSFNFTNAKVALGYRGDFFFGAMDVGNNARKTGTAGFFGPYASISVGLGD